MSSLFIGLGGVGSGTLDHLYDKMKAYNDDMRRRGNPEVNASTRGCSSWTKSECRSR